MKRAMHCLVTAMILMGVSGSAALSGGDRSVAIVILKDQPAQQDGPVLLEEFYAEVQPISKQLRTLATKDNVVLTTLEHAMLIEEYRAAKARFRAQLVAALQAEIAVEQAAVADTVRRLGGSIVYRYTVVNAIAVRLPATQWNELRRHPLVATVIADYLLNAQLDVSIPSIFASSFWNDGFEGAGAIGCTIDSGVDTAHPALSQTSWQSGVFLQTAQGDSNFNDNTTADDLQGHGTHVAGIARSRDASYRGVAFGAQAVNAKAGWRSTNGGAYMYWSDCIAAVDWAITAANADSCNLSYGSIPSEDYPAMAAFWDSVSTAFGVLHTHSAGNDGPNSGTVHDPSVSYNGFSVAAMDDRNTPNRSDDVIADFSSRGPTINGRRKPDLAAPGSAIRSTNAFWETEDDFVEYWGTSMAAPHLQGAADLLLSAGVFRPTEMKALLINTSDKWGANDWDNSSGWGYVNLDAARSQRPYVYSGAVNQFGSRRQEYLINLPAGSRVTLVWQKRNTYNGNYPVVKYALSNLNLFLYDDQNRLVASSTLVVDNVEQIVAPSAVNGKVVVELTGAIDGEVSEQFSVAFPVPIHRLQILLPAPAEEVGGPWPMFRGNRLHTGVSSLNKGPQTATLRWRRSGVAWFASPAVGSTGIIYIAQGTSVFALNPANGTQKWRYTTGGTTNSSPAVGNNTVYIGSRDRYLHAINLLTGAIRWKYLTGGEIVSSPAIGSGGVIFVGATNGKLYAINPDGTLRWSYQAGTPIDESSPAIGPDGTIYIGSENHYLTAIYPNGTLRWRYLTGGGVTSSPAIGPDGTIYVGSDDRYVYAVTKDGKLGWRYLTGSYVFSSPALDGNTVYVGSVDGKVYALESSSGVVRWIFPTGGAVNSSPVVGSDGAIYVGSSDRVLYCLNPDGTQKWRYTTGGAVDGSAAFAPDGTLYVPSGDSYLYAFKDP